MKVSSEAARDTKHLAVVLPVIESFWKEMYDWERHCMNLHAQFKHGTISHAQLKSTILPIVKGIFDKYCICGKKGPKRILNDRYVFGDPPDYDPTIDTLLRVTCLRDGFEIVVESGSRADCIHMYTLKSRDGTLRLVDRRTLLDEDDAVVSGL